MAQQRILTETDMARLLAVDVQDLIAAFQRGEVPGFEMNPGVLRCTEPAFFDWAEKRSREANATPSPRDLAERAEAAYSEHHPDHFAALAIGPLPALVGRELSTPDRRRSRPFRLDAVDLDRPGLLVSPLENRAAHPMWIRAEAVNRCLTFLEEHVPPGEPAAIQASQNNPGPLARFTRRGNGGVRCLHYLLPILQQCGRVSIDGDTRPNTVMLDAQSPRRKARRHG
jgi:hypothetical protein